MVENRKGIVEGVRNKFLKNINKYQRSQSIAALDKASLKELEPKTTNELCILKEKR